MAAEAGRRFGFPKTIRTRATIGAVAVVGLVLVGAAIVQFRVVEHHLVESAQRSAELRAVDVAERIRTDGVPAELPLGDDDTTFVQVVDGRGRPLAASENVETRRRVVPLRADLDDEETGETPDYEVTAATFGDLPVDEEGRWRVVAVAVATDAGSRTIYVGSSLDDVDETLATLRRSLLVGVPLLLLVVGLVTMWVIGRALRPVTAMRTDLDEITSRHLDRRVARPTTDDEITQLALAMNQLLDRLEASVVRERRLIGDASHELRSPLAALRTQLDVALAHPDLTNWPETVGGALRDTERIESLASDLLVLARLDSGAPAPASTPVDLGQLVADTVADARNAGSVRVQVRLEPDVIVHGRTEQLRRAVRNLLDNALRHAATQVVVRVARSGDLATITVSDDGPGIPVADRERVFERFVRLDEARTRDEGGVGLGLAITHEIIRGHDGDIEVADLPASGSRDGSGVTFVIRLPMGIAS